MKNPISLSDQELIQAFQHGDINAFDTLIYRHKNKIFASIFLLVKDKYLAEDIFQETFIKAISKIRDGKYSEEGKFLPWVMRIAHNLCMDHFRSEKSKVFYHSFEGEDVFDNLQISEEDASTHITRQQTHDRLRLLLDQLPAEQREVVILKHYANLSFKQIAGITQTSINTSLGRMRYALLNLRKIIDQNELVLI